MPPGLGAGTGPWVQADLETGLFQASQGFSENPLNTGLSVPFVTALLKNNGPNYFALKVGNAVSTAEVWKEISHPPYFVGYRGAITNSAHTLVFYKGTEIWTVSKYPSALAVGNTWELTDDRHDQLTLKIEKVEGAKFTLSATDRFRPNVREVIEATHNGDTFATDRILYMPAAKGGEKHAAALTFTPGLGTGNSSTLDLTIARKKAIATATLSTSGDAPDRTTALQFTAPTWAATKTLAEETATSGDTVTLTAR